VDIELSGPLDIFEDYPETVEIRARLKNLRPGNLQLKEMNASEPCFKQVGEFEATELPPGGVAETKWRLDRADISVHTAYPMEIMLTVLSEDDGMEHCDRRVVTVRPKPVVEPAHVRIVLSASSEAPSKLESELTLNDAACELFTGIDTMEAPDWLEAGGDLTGHTLRLTISVGTEIPAPDASAESTVHIRIVFGESYPAVPVTLEFQRSPIEFLRTDEPIRVLTGQIRWKDLPFRNVSDKTLKLQEVRVEFEIVDGPYDELPPDAVRMESVKNLLISPGQERDRNGDVRVRIDGFTLGPCTVRLVVLYEVEDTPELLTARYTIEVIEPEEALGVLAVDFGTSNTCCAYLDSTLPSARLVPLDEHDKTITMVPSSLARLDTDDWRIGNEAEDLPGATLRLLKLKLGSTRALVDNLTAKEMVCFFLREVLWKSERHLNKRIRRLVLTYPTRFSNRQMADLRWISKQLQELYPQDAPCVIEFADEATAGAVNFIGAVEGKEKFTLMVVDYGGGTTDISFFRIVFPPTGATELMLLNMGGNRNFGGTHCTELLMEMVTESFVDRLIVDAAGGLTRDKIYIPFRADELQENPLGFPASILESLKTNVEACSESIERAKLELTAEARDTPLDVKSNIKAAIHGQEPYCEELQSVLIDQDDFIERFKERFAAIQTTSKKIFEEAEHMVAHQETGETDLSDALSRDPDYVLLVGQSSRMRVPDLKALLKEVFPESQIESYDGDPTQLKTCVCEGAVRIGMQIIAGIEVFKSVESFMGKARSSIGRMDLDGRLRRVLTPIVRKGDPLPAVGNMDRSIRKGMLVEVMENFGFNNVFDQAADDMEPIDLFDLDPGRIRDIEPSELENARIELSVTRDETVDLNVVVPAGNQNTNEKRIGIAPMARSE
jgi:hypothetical protein